MSYCRFGNDSDVYMYEAATDDDTPRWVCCGCLLQDVAYLSFPSRGEMLAHLGAHRDVGHAVPEAAFQRLRREIAEIRA